MFNRFAMAARQAVAAAAHEARAAKGEVTEERLLLALLRQPDTTSAQLLDAAGVTESAVDAAFREAERKGGLSDTEAAVLLHELGIDLDQVVATVEDSLGEGALVETPRRRNGHFTDTAKAILRGALNQARSLRSKELGDEHLLLAIAAHDGVAGQLLATHGLSYLDIRTSLAPDRSLG